MNDSTNTEEKLTGPAIVFTDMDGTLLDHDTYSWQPAKEILAQLESHGIPVIFNTSKTRAELEFWKKETNNRHPFIVENGSAIFVPKNYLDQSNHSNDDYCITKLGVDRSTILSWLSQDCTDYSDEYVNFATLNVEQLIDLTDLPKQQAELALQRDFSEAIQWTGSAERKQTFILQAKNAGYKVLIGGRFLHILGQTDKGTASQALFDQLRNDLLANSTEESSEIMSVACGDSDNDIDMLEWASVAVLVRSKHRAFPVVNNKNIRKTSSFGPKGLAEELKSIFFQ